MRKIIAAMTKLVKPCVFYKELETKRGLKLDCQYDGARRNRCRTVYCPHFRPTLRYRIAQYFGMVR